MDVFVSCSKPATQQAPHLTTTAGPATAQEALRSSALIRQELLKRIRQGRASWPDWHALSNSLGAWLTYRQGKLH